MKKLFSIFLAFISCVLLNGCSENITSPVQETLVFEKQGLLDSINGTCSSYIVSDQLLDTLDLTGFNNVKLTFDASTDGDLSNIDIYFVQDSIVKILQLNGLQINNSIEMTVPSPMVKQFFKVQLRLFSSVCTGHIYHLSLRNLKIYGIN